MWSCRVKTGCWGSPKRRGSVEHRNHEGFVCVPGRAHQKNKKTVWQNQRGMTELDILKTWWKLRALWGQSGESQGMSSCLLTSHQNCLGLFAHLLMPHGFGEVVCKSALKQMLGLAIIYWFMISTWIHALKTGLGNVMLRSIGCVLWAMEWRGWGCHRF